MALIQYRWSRKKAAGSEVWCGRKPEDLPFKKVDDLHPEIFASYSGPEDGLALVPTLPKAGQEGDQGKDNKSSTHTDEVAGALSWGTKSRKAYGICMSLYDQHPINRKISGDPVADSFGVCARKNNCTLIVADGVNWGEKSKLAARCAVFGAMRFINEQLFKEGRTIKTTHDIFELLLESIHVSHRTILEHAGGLTTLCVAIVVPHRDSKKYIVCIVNVGDSLAYVFSKRHGVREITTGSHDIESERDIRDAGGAVGPVNGDKPELNNLTCSFTFVDRGDIVFLTSDGISDNFDPVVTKIAVARQPKTDDSDSKETTKTVGREIPLSADGRPEMAPYERHRYAVKEMERIIHEFELFTEQPCSAQELCGALLQHVLKLTDSKRKVLENPELYGKKLKAKERKKRDAEIVGKMKSAPGKLDHATVIGYEVGHYHGNDDEDYEQDSDEEFHQQNLSLERARDSMSETEEDHGIAPGTRNKSATYVTPESFTVEDSDSNDEDLDRLPQNIVPLHEVRQLDREQQAAAAAATLPNGITKPCDWRPKGREELKETQKRISKREREERALSGMQETLSQTQAPQRSLSSMSSHSQSSSSTVSACSQDNININGESVSFSKHASPKHKASVESPQHMAKSDSHGKSTIDALVALATGASDESPVETRDTDKTAENNSSESLCDANESVVENNQPGNEPGTCLLLEKSNQSLDESSQPGNEVETTSDQSCDEAATAQSENLPVHCNSELCQEQSNSVTDISETSPSESKGPLEEIRQNDCDHKTSVDNAKSHVENDGSFQNGKLSSDNQDNGKLHQDSDDENKMTKEADRDSSERQVPDFLCEDEFLDKDYLGDVSGHSSDDSLGEYEVKKTKQKSKQVNVDPVEREFCEEIEDYNLDDGMDDMCFDEDDGKLQNGDEEGEDAGNFHKDATECEIIEVENSTGVNDECVNANIEIESNENNVTIQDENEIENENILIDDKLLSPEEISTAAKVEEFPQGIELSGNSTPVSNGEAFSNGDGKTESKEVKVVECDGNGNSQT